MSGTVEGAEALALPDLARRQANTIRIGTVLAVDPAGYRVRIKSGSIETDWLKWGVKRAKGTRSWHAPAVGEQVVLACPSGDLRQGVVLCAIPQDSAPPAGNSGDVERTIYPDGAVEEYDHAAHSYKLEVPSGGKITLKVGATTLELRADGTTLTTPAFQGVQS